MYQIVVVQFSLAVIVTLCAEDDLISQEAVMIRQNISYKHIITSLLFFSGIYLAISGEFILASSLFCLAFISSIVTSNDSFKA
ncbi:hypothetical protein [Methylomonas sp. AM2-LC]|uniref:hypothetical protein n=1 Tax=Methylomonas sp. AM2-LC TaxID=3153301 RepID=UPI003265379B